MSEYELPAGVPSGGPEIGDDPAAAERRALHLLRRTGDEIIEGVERVLPDWAAREVARLVSDWGRHDDETREAIIREARRAGEAAARRVTSELREMLALDPDAQGVTPLQVVRTAYREVGAVLREAGIPPIERDEFSERMYPEDEFGLAPDTLADLGDEDLAPLHLAWGVAKATVHKARRAR